MYSVAHVRRPEITKEPQTAKYETEIMLRDGIYRKLPFAAMRT